MKGWRARTQPSHSPHTEAYDHVYLTFQGQPVVLHATCHVLAYHPLHILQGLWGQGMAEAGLLPPGRKGFRSVSCPRFLSYAGS